MVDTSSFLHGITTDVGRCANFGFSGRAMCCGCLSTLSRTMPLSSNHFQYPRFYCAVKPLVPPHALYQPYGHISNKTPAAGASRTYRRESDSFEFDLSLSLSLIAISIPISICIYCTIHFNPKKRNRIIIYFNLFAVLSLSFSRQINVFENSRYSKQTACRFFPLETEFSFFSNQIDTR